MSGQLTRSDFEALLWDYLYRHLCHREQDDLIDSLGLTRDQWVALTDGERAEFLAALNLVTSETGRNVWQKEGDPR